MGRNPNEATAMTTWLLRLSTHDERALHGLVVRRHGWINCVMRTITHAGDAYFTIPAAALLLVAGPGVSGITAAVVLAGSHLVVQLLKGSVARARPHLPVGIPSLVHAPDRFSFPSGHAAASLSIALPLAMTLPLWLGAPLIVLALLVGVSRCYLGIHYPGDVVVGWLLAAIATLLANSFLLQ